MKCKCGWEMRQSKFGQYYEYACPSCKRTYRRENFLGFIRFVWTEPPESVQLNEEKKTN